MVFKEFLFLMFMATILYKASAHTDPKLTVVNVYSGLKGDNGNDEKHSRLGFHGSEYDYDYSHEATGDRFTEWSDEIPEGLSGELNDEYAYDYSVDEPTEDKFFDELSDELSHDLSDGLSDGLSDELNDGFNDGYLFEDEIDRRLSKKRKKRNRGNAATHDTAVVPWKYDRLKREHDAHVRKEHHTHLKNEDESHSRREHASLNRRH